MTIQELKSEFCKLYGRNDSDIRIFASPGRVNLIGEHTDYNGGYVLPAALSMQTVIALRQNNTNKINLAATDLPDRVSLDIDNLENYKDLKWGNYQAGVAYVLQKAGYNILGCDLLYDDTVPHGAGLSSSAAIEVSTAYALATLSNETNKIEGSPDLKEMAVLSQKAENEYCGVNSGIMDQFASAFGKEKNAIFIDCLDLSYKYVPLDLTGYRIIISNTKKKRSLADSKYNERRAQCEKALEELKTAYPKAECLRDISVAEFEEARSAITDDIAAIRAEHVIYECDRVLKSIDALSKGDITLFGKLMTASHISLRDLYEVTGFELDTLVEEALKIDGCIGSRMTGAGFGGCTVSIVSESRVDDFIENVRENYIEKTGLIPEFYIANTGNGVREIK